MQAKLNTALIPHAHGRDERLELPEDALREAMVNAIAHRDYRSTAKVQVHIFYDRLEIVTPGGLPAGMREEALGIRSVTAKPPSLRNVPPHGNGRTDRQRHPAHQTGVP